MTPEQPPYFKLNDLTNEIRLSNGSECLTFDRTELAPAEQKLNAVKRLLEAPGIDKAQILMLLTATDNP